jgi:hypothetical protein
MFKKNGSSKDCQQEAYDLRDGKLRDKRKKKTKKEVKRGEHLI